RRSSLSSPASPRNKPLKEPPALLAHRGIKAERKQQPKVAPTVSARTGGGGVDSTQLRLHGRWMDLATQAAEAPTSDAKKKVRTKLHLSSEGDVGKRTASQILGIKLIKPFHPHSAFRICWDLTAMVLIFGDTVLLPIALAWDISMFDQSGQGRNLSFLGSMLYVSFWISLTFWTLDLAVNLNTATYRKGTLLTSRTRILISYMTGWLTFDLLLLCFDIVYLTSESYVSVEFRLLRVTRILRLLRLLRMLKLTKVNSIIEESAANSGRQWVTVVIAIVNTTMLILVCVHILTCMWFWVGRLTEIPVYEVSETLNEYGYPLTLTGSWTQLAFATDLNVHPALQYLHAMRWIVNSPSPPVLDPNSGLERGLDIAVSIFVIAVIGSAVSKISGTLAELRAMNEARDRRRREVRQYLSSQHVSFELVGRIMRFVDYRLEKFSTTALDTSLISPTLQLELYVGQRSNYVLEMPIFKLLNECYHDVFGSVCAALNKNVYEKEENVFVAGSWVSYLHITATGTYDYIEGFDQEGECHEFSGVRWFGELSLYTEGTLHQSSLSAQSFAETFTLSGQDLAECVKQSRGCMSMFCDYAKDFVSAMQGTATKCGDADQVEKAEECCKKNQHYQELYPDPKTRLHNIQIPSTASTGGESSELSAFAPGEQARDEERTEKSEEDRASTENPSLHSVSKESLGDSVKSAHFDLVDFKLKREKAKGLTDPGLGGWLSAMMKAGQSVELDETLPAKLQELLPELSPEFSPHIVFEQNAERDRAESSCLSILALLKDRYDIFTKPQAPNVKLRAEQWHELQELVRWIEPDFEQIHAVMVLLAVRGLGKSKSVLQQMPRHMRRPEKAVLFLMESQKNVVPSVGWLGPRALTFINDALAVHELFNLAQMLQGENLPGNIAQLRECIDEKGPEVFRFYILFLLGFMSGIAAGQGSRFMNGKNASSVISGVRLLKRLMECNPTAIYWGYLEERAQKLRVSFYSAEDLVLTRLSCLARAQDEKDYLLLRTSWDALKARERLALTDHFLADGIQDQAFVLEFLPNCMANAKANTTVGLVGLLGVLVDLLNNLNTSLESMPQMDKMIPVDLSEMAEFIAVVQNRFVFLTCVSRCQLQFVGQRVYLKMTGSNWGRTTDPDSDMTSLAYTLQDILQKQEVLEAYIMRRHEDPTALVTPEGNTRASRLSATPDMHLERVNSMSSSTSQEVRQAVF
ncbi:Potassium/sodium hyperpolarization-activated cyclic nucleotide-gated channel 4 (Hyperpolarization-activated cation channel 4) (HAC-4), partial [Durusdinium trenchii]